MAYVSKINDAAGTSYDIRSYKTAAIPYGECDSTSTATAFTATVDGIKTLYDGVCVLLKNGVVTSASGFTININGLGEKPVYNNMATGNDVTPTSPTRDTTIFNINYTMLLVYSSDIVSGGGWICYRGYDGNTNTIGYQLRTNSGNLEASDTGYRYRLWFTSADGKKWVPANTSTSTDATTARTMNTRPINPFGPIVYNSTNGTVNSGARPAVGTLWQQYTLTIGYSYVISLTAWDPVYVQCTPQTDGSAVMNAIVKALPTSNDGKIYIYLGIAYSATAIELRTEHPVFYHDGTGIRFWTGKTIPTKTSELTNDSGYTTNVGTITGVTAGTGLSGGGTSGSVTLNHSNSVTAQTTQALYPIKYDAQGHITGAGTAVTSLPASDVSAWAKAATKPSYTFSEIGSKPTSISGYGITDAYTKTEVDGLVSGVLHYKGTKATTSALPSSGNVTGDVWHVTADGSEWAWDGTTWQELGTAVDLSGYVPTSRTVNGKALTGNISLTSSDVGALSDDTTVDSATTGISISDHATGSIYGVQSTTTSVTGVQSSTTTASKVTLGTAISVPNVTGASDVTVPIKNTSATTVPIKNASATSIPNVTAAGSGSFTQGTDEFTAATHGSDSFTPNTPTVIDTTKFNAGSYSHTGFSGGSYTRGSFNGGSGSFTQGAFNGGSLTMTMDSTDTKKLNIVFTAATHGSDSHTHTAATHGNDSFTAASYGTDTFVAPSLGTGFYTAGTAASYTQGSFSGGSFTQGVDSHTHTPPTLGTAISIIGVQSSTTSVTGVQSNTTTASKVTLGDAISVPNVTGATDVTVPIKATSATTVPIKNGSATTVVTGASHSVTDDGHTHTLS